MKERKFIGGCSTELLRSQTLHPETMRGRLVLFFAVMGPGLITAFADNDAGGIATYIIAGAHYGYAMLFVLLISTVFLAVAQEISARTGIVTGQGLFDLIRVRYGTCSARLIMVILLIANLGTTVSEFSGIAIGFEIFSVHKWISVPLAAAVIWFLVVRANYGFVEKVFFVLCASFASYIISGFMVKPPWGEVLSAAITPSFSGDSAFLLMAMGIVGTTITPWGQFYIQAAVIDKGLTVKNYPYTVADVLVGTFFTGLVAFFIIVSTAATLHGTVYGAEDFKSAAIALTPLAGSYATGLFAIGLLGASMLAAVILPLSTAYAVCESLQQPHGISKSYREAPVFFQVYTALVVAGAGLVLLPQLSLYHLMLATQVLNGVLLPPILIFMLLIAHDRNIMGAHQTPRLYNAIAWVFTALIILLTVVLAAAAFFSL